LRNLFRITGLAALVAGALLATPVIASANPSEVYANDGCSPSFNDVVGPGTCTSPGGTPFNVFVQELMLTGSAGAWHFSAPQVNLSPGSTLGVGNRGGETHTFTEVAQFGGGCIAFLNDLLGLTPVPECAGFPGGAFAASVLPAGTEAENNPVGPLSPGIHRFQCLIHPWMHVTVDVG
jgi:hypothetical protein